MYTQCPHCQTCFRIAEDHLKIANGKVRCGSCQEVFDATQHLFKNLTDREPVTFNPTKPAAPRQSPPAKPASPPAPANKHTDKIDLNHDITPSPQSVEKILNERQNAPDQKPFMESTIGNDRYNDLNQMKPVDIPGQIEFGDSVIQFAGEDDTGQTPASAEETSHTHQDIDLNPAPASKTPPDQSDWAEASSPPPATPPSRTIYEDIESKEAPVTEAEQETLKNFFAEVDAQLDEEEDRSRLDKDIDELLAFAKGLDRDSPPQAQGEPTTSDIDIDVSAPADTQGHEASDKYDMQAIADFEKELEASNPDVFSSVNDRQETAQAELDEAQPTQEPVRRKDNTPAKTDSSAGTEAETALDVETDDVLLPAAETHPEQDEDVPRALRDSLKMLNHAPRRSPGKSLLMVLLILILLGGLGFQVVLFRNVELAHKFPSLVPELSAICERIPCRYSGQVDVSQIKLINRDVRSDPNQPNALLISATFVDKAPFDQPYPIIKITLYDLGGNVVASRRFTPKEYLQKMYNRFLLMEAGTPVRITLAVLDPGKDAINFEFSFL